MSENLQQVIEEMDTKMAELDALLSRDGYGDQPDLAMESIETKATVSTYGTVMAMDGTRLAIVPAA